MTYFFPLSDRWVARFFCVEVQSLIDPAVNAWVCVAGGENPQQTPHGLFRACVYFFTSLHAVKPTDEILKLPFKDKIAFCGHMNGAICKCNKCVGN